MVNIDIPFPECPRCRKKTDQSRHLDCRGAEFVRYDVETATIICPGCRKNYRNLTVRYHCNCGRIFFGEIDFKLLQNRNRRGSARPVVGLFYQAAAVAGFVSGFVIIGFGRLIGLVTRQLS